MADRGRLSQLEFGHWWASIILLYASLIAFVGQKQDGAWSERLLRCPLLLIAIFLDTCFALFLIQLRDGLLRGWLRCLIIQYQRLFPIHRCGLRARAPTYHFYNLLLEGELTWRLLTDLIYWLLRSVYLALVILSLIGLTTPRGARVRLSHILNLLVLCCKRVVNSSHRCLSVTIIIVARRGCSYNLLVRLYQTLLV